METDATQEDMDHKEIECAGSSRRGFLRQVAAAGAGGAALELLMGTTGSQRAEAALPPQETVRTDDYLVQIVDGVAVKVCATANISACYGQVLDPSKPVAVPIPIGGYPAQTVNVYATWHVPIGHLENLSQFEYLVLEPSGDRTSLSLSVQAAAGTQNTQVVIRAFTLHDPVAR